MPIKLKKRFLYLLILICEVGLMRSFSQDVSFSQFYSNPLYLNPAFAGSVELPRASFQYRNQWASLDDAYKTVSAAYDVPVKKLQGGIGIHLMNDVLSAGILNSFQADFMYASHIQINNSWKLHGGLQAGIHQNSLNWGSLVFPDNVDMNFGNHGVTAETPIDRPNYLFFDASAGILLFNEQYFIGLAGHHLNKPNQSYYDGQDGDVGLDRKITFHAGGKIPIFRHGHLRKKYDISPQIIIQKQGEFTQFNYGLFANLRGFTAGTWFRQNFTFNYDAIILLVGFVKKRWHITYSYDWTVSGLWGGSGGSSEISLSMLLKNPKKSNYLPFYRIVEE